MAKNKAKVGGTGPFFCAVAGNGQIFIPAKMMEAMGIKVGSIVAFSVSGDGVSALFTKDAEASKENQNQGKKDKEDAEKRTEAAK